MSILKVDTINEKTSGSGVEIAHVLKGSGVAGHVVQVGHTYNHQVSAHQTIASTSLVGSGVTCTITPRSTNNKFIVSWTVSMAYGGNNASYCSGAMKYKIGSGSYVYVDGVDVANTPYNLGYNYSGDQYGPMASMHEVDITSASAYTFEPHYKSGNGSSSVWCHIRAGYSLLVMEIAG